jgi:transposase
MRPPSAHHPVSFKAKVVRDIVENLLSLQQTAIKYRIGVTTASRWAHLVKSGGYEALIPLDKPPNMGRPKKKEPESEVEKQAAELRYLRAENACEP